MQQIAIIGLGLLGASLAYALLAKRNQSVRISAFDTNQETQRIAQANGIQTVNSIDALFTHAVDILILAVPVVAMEKMLREQAEVLSKARIITDVGSVKANLLRAASCHQTLFERFVPAHPMAGTEHSGIQAAQAHLFENQTVILTPHAHTPQHAITSVVALWRSVGTRVQYMDATIHDKVLAYASHLPHILSFNFMHCVAESDDRHDIFHYGASGFRDFTRIAASDTTMWSNIVTSNKSNILAALDTQLASLQQMRMLIERNDSEALAKRFTYARHARHLFSSVYTMKTNTQYKDALYAHQSSQPLNGCISIPGDKSMSHRAVMLGALAQGTTRVQGSLMGEDNIRTQDAFRAMGVTIENHEQSLVIHGVGKNGLCAPAQTLYMGNSGTAIRLLSGLLAAQSFASTLSGDESLNARPMKRIIEPLTQMGARIASDNNTPPLHIEPSKINAIEYHLPVASAQVKSAILLAGLYADSATTVHETAISRDHTERMLRTFGAQITTDVQGSTRISHLQPNTTLQGCNIQIPGDFSSAAFFIVAALIQPESDLYLQSIGMNDTRIGALHILKSMGADITLENKRTYGEEPVADVRVRHSHLRAIDITAEQVPLAIDEFPIIFIAAALATGTTTLCGAQELRVKESDRLVAMAEGLSRLGVAVELLEEGMKITGQEYFEGGEVDSMHDHRIAMSFAIASLRSRNSITILNAHNIVTSFPQFVSLANSVGCDIQTLQGT